MPSVLFGGANNTVKTLAPGIQLQNGAAIFSISVDPTLVATVGNIGDVAISTSTGNMYQKTTTSGTDTNWVIFDTAGNVTFANVGSSPNAQAASLSGSTITLEPADGTHPGLLTSGVQTIGGNKTFTGTIAASNLSGTNTGDQTITLTSDVTGSGTGSFATSVAKIQGTTVSGTTGSGNVVFSTSPSLTTPALGTPSSGTLTNATGLPLTSGVTGVLPIANGGTNVGSVTIVPTATAFAGWDANKNLSANNLIDGFRTQATANSTLTLAVGDAGQQDFTGSTSGQIVKLPATTALVAGQSYILTNRSTQTITVQSNGAGAILTMAANTQTIFTVVNAASDGASSWNYAITNSQTTPGTVTSVSVVSANGFTGSVATSTTTPAITLTTSINAPALAGNGTAISAATTTGSGSTVVLAISPSLTTPVLGTPTSGTLTNCTGLPLSSGVTGTLQAANFPALTGDVTTSAGSLSTSIAATSNSTLTTLSGLTTASSLATIGTITSGTWHGTTIGTSYGGTGATIDLAPGSFSAANNQSSAANVTGLSFSTSTIRAFTAYVSVSLVATSSLYEYFTLNSIYNGSSWQLAQTSVGDNSGVAFSITSAGQVQYTSANSSGFVSNTMKYRAVALGQ